MTTLTITDSCSSYCHRDDDMIENEESFATLDLLICLLNPTIDALSMVLCHVPTFACISEQKGQC
jgi:hypothetical protein